MKTNRRVYSSKCLAALAAVLVGGAQPKADVATKPLQTFGYGNVAAMAVSHDGKSLVTAGIAGAFLWDIETAKVIRKFAADGPSVTCVALSSDGKRLVTGGAPQWPLGGAAMLWDVETGQKLRTFERLTNGVEIFSVACSPDGSQVMAGGSDGTARLWDVATGQLRLTLPGLSNDVRAVEFSSDGHQFLTAGHLYSGGYYAAAYLWDAATGQILHSLTTTNGALRVATFSPDGSRVLLAGERWSGGGFGRVWDTETGQLVSECSSVVLPAMAVLAARFSADGTKVYSVCQYYNPPARLAEMWDAATGDLVRTFPDSPATSPVENLNVAAFLPDGRSLLTVDASWSQALLRQYHLETGALVRRFIGHGQGIAAALSPDGHQVLTGGPEGSCLWEANSGELLRVFDETNQVTSIAYSSDGAKALTVGWFGSEAANWQVGTLRVWDTSSGALLQAIFKTNEWSVRESMQTAAFSPDRRPGRQAPVPQGIGPHIQTGPILSAVLSPDTTKILSIESVEGASDPATGTWLRSAYLRDYAGGRPLLRIGSTNQSVSSALFSPGGRSVLLISGEPRLQVYDGMTGALTRVLGSEGEAGCFSPDGRLAATWNDWDGRVSLWDVETGRLLRQSSALIPVPSYWELPALSADGAFLGMARGYDDVTIWDTQLGGYPLRLVRESMVGFGRLAYSSDGQRLLAFGGQGMASLWDLADLVDRDWYSKGWNLPACAGQPLRRFGRRAQPVMFSADGRGVLTRSEVGGARLWDIWTGQVIEEFGDYLDALLLGEFRSPYSSAQSPDHRRFLKANETYLDLTDVADGETGRVLVTIDGEASGASFSPVGPLVLTARGYGSMLWDSATGQPLREFNLDFNSDEDQQPISFSPDGLVLVGQHADGTVNLWDIRDLAVGLRTAFTAQGRELRWERGRLQEADAVTGPWRDLWGASSPMPFSALGPNRFYRVVLE